MEIEPFQALIKTYKKYVVLFLALISSFFFVSGAFAQELQAPNEQDGKKITVRASVPLTPEFIFSIKKNSSLELTKAAFALGEEVRVQVKIVSGNNFPLRNHKINLQVVNNKKEVSLVLSRETDNDGLVYFSFIADVDLLGEHTLRAVDVTYDEPIIISKERALIVYKPSDGKRERELAEQKIITREFITSKQIQSNEAHQIFVGADILQNSGTIITDHQTKLTHKWSSDP